MTSKIQKIEKIFSKVTKLNQIHEATLLVENTKGDFSYSVGYGGKDANSLLIMASITKLFTTTCILILEEQGKISLNDKLTKYFDNSILEGLHRYRGKEYSFDLTIYNLLFQTSGLPDVYEESSNSIKNSVIKEDAYIDFNEMITIVKRLKPHFAPNINKKAFYADINFDLLGEIIEKITKLPLHQVYKKFIFEPLGLCNTYLPISEGEQIPNIYYKNESLYRPKVIMCSRASGGCISTSKELMIFLKAFFGGKLFNEAVFRNSLSTYRKLQISMTPIRYGCGHMQIPLGSPALFFQGKGELVGHSGSTGSFAFYYPLKDLFFVGNVNQMADPRIPIKLIIQLAMLIK